MWYKKKLTSTVCRGHRRSFDKWLSSWQSKSWEEQRWPKIDRQPTWALLPISNSCKKNIKKCNGLTWFSWPVAIFFATSNLLLSWPMPVYSRSWQLWLRPNMLKHYGRFCQISSGFLDGCAISSSIYKFCFSLAKLRGFNLFIFSEKLITVSFMGNKCYRVGSLKM